MANEITWRLEHERIGRLLLHYAMPAVIGTMVNALYNIVDRIFIGQGVGPLAMAGLMTWNSRARRSRRSGVGTNVRNAHRGGGCDACLHLSGTKGE